MTYRAQLEQAPHESRAVTRLSPMIVPVPLSARPAVACETPRVLRRRSGKGLGLLLLACGLTSSTPALAEGAMDGDRALPALGHVGLAQQRPQGSVAAAASVGFGFTESQTRSDGSHERLGSRLALSAYAARWLAFGLLADGRYDHHRADAQGADSGALLRPELASRASAAFGTLSLGAEAAAWVPAAANVSSSFKDVSLDLRGLLSQRLNQLTIGGLAGFRLDRSADSAGDPAKLRRGDRIALGASDFNAVLAGLGMTYDLGKTELIAEASADLLVGSGAPALSKSPLRVSAGAREKLGSSGLSAELLVDGLLSGRPSIDPAARLAPIEPRFTVSIGLRYRFGGEPHAPPPPPPVEQRAPEAVKTQAPAEAVLEITLTDEQGQPLENATVEIITPDQKRPLEATGAGHYRLKPAPSGPARVHVHADGRQDIERELTLEPGAPLHLDLQAQPALPAGQVRGLVRSFRGKALTAKIRVEPVGVEATTDGEGFFQVDVPPGDYEIVIQAPGFVTQRRKAHVDKLGVVIVNADLSQGK